MTFNLSDRVRVRLTPIGAAYWSQYLPVPSTGVVTCQLHELMRVFGPHISVGVWPDRRNVFFVNNDIEFLDALVL